MNILKPIIIAFILMGVSPCLSASSKDANVLIDVVILRPLGFVSMIGGAAVFLGLSPLTAFAAIPEPHDSFEKMGDILVVNPAKFTFEREVGDFSFVNSDD
ncbi:hypothetical protein Q9L42_013885 [Methylomarinum sp. Ch1-1]|uniref:Uncharacterized protein n=1 Tax=Methylomarinum roseum TaxID=3067653 RepID=A0AAU7NR69_9GAMM|nr:hypothetical protein [Methylomarinum sp. Ch1-1]MDP4520589.1 hypothetical protein [Methylomarinum sp. Ch1-1]